MSISFKDDGDDAIARVGVAFSSGVVPTYREYVLDRPYGAEDVPWVPEARGPPVIADITMKAPPTRSGRSAQQGESMRMALKVVEDHIGRDELNLQHIEAMNDGHRRSPALYNYVGKNDIAAVRLILNDAAKKTKTLLGRSVRFRT